MVRQRGFTMIEILLVLALSMIGLLGLMALQVVAIRGNDSARTMTEATTLAHSRIEAMRRLPLATLAGATEAHLDGTGQTTSTGIFNRTTVVQARPASTSIVVTVAWTDLGGRPHQVVMSTLRGL